MTVLSLSNAAFPDCLDRWNSLLFRARASQFFGIADASFGGCACRIHAHWIGLGAGIVFLFTSIIYPYFQTGMVRVFTLPHLLICLMLILTLISQFNLSTKMADLRTSIGRLIRFRQTTQYAYSSTRYTRGPRAWKLEYFCLDSSWFI